MKPAYSPDNTRSSLAVVVLIALGVALVAVLVGLSDKPDVSVIGITADQFPADAVAAGSAAAEPAATNDDTTTVEVDELGNPIVDSGSGAAASPESAMADGATTPETAVDAAPTATTAPAPTQIAPTPEVAPAVVPTPIPESEITPEPVEEELGPDPSAGLSPSAGAVQGAFFTNVDEEDGAVVATNTITIAFNEDGTGTFSGMLDITYSNGDRATIDMSGPIRWSTGDPQIEANLAGTYTLEASIADDNVSAKEAKLTVSSLRSGVGSLCTPKCFGITFTPPQGL